MEDRAEILYNEATRTIRYTGTINEFDVMQLIDLLDEVITVEPRDAVTLYLFTYGGTYDATIALYDYIKFEQTPIHTVVSGTAMSGGTLITACGSGERVAFPNARFMIHGLQHSIGSGSHVDNSIELKEDERLNEKFVELLAFETDNSVEKVREDLKRDRYLSADEALEYGLIDRIVGEE